MRELQQRLENLAVRRLAWVLVAFVWQGALVAAFLACLGEPPDSWEGEMTDGRNFGTRSRHLILALLCFSLSAPSRAENVEGRWMLDFDRENGRVQLTRRRTTSHGQWNNSSSSYKLEDFRGLTRPSGTASRPAALEKIRDAGTARFAFTVCPSTTSRR